MERMKKELLKNYQGLINLTDVYLEKIKKSIESFKEFDDEISSFFPYPKENKYFESLTNELNKIKLKSKIFIKKLSFEDGIDDNKLSLINAEYQVAKELLLTCDEQLENSSVYTNTIPGYKLMLLNEIFKTLYEHQMQTLKEKVEEADEKVKTPISKVFTKKDLESAENEKYLASKKCKDLEIIYSLMDKEKAENIRANLGGMIKRLKDSNNPKIKKDVELIGDVLIPRLDNLDEILIVQDRKEIDLDNTKTR